MSAVTPPVVRDDEKLAQVAVVLLFGFTPSDRALAGWCPGFWLDQELSDLGIVVDTGDAA